MQTKEGGIPSGTTTIINQEASNHILGRLPANPLSYYTYIAPRQPGYQLVSSSSQGLQSTLYKSYQQITHYANPSIMLTICKPYQLITSICSPHQQITSVSVNPDKQVDIIMVTHTQHVNKYISRHPQIRVAKQHKQRAKCTEVQQLIPTS